MQFYIRKSGIYALLLISVHLFAAVGLGLTDLDFLARAGLLVLVLLSLLYHFYLYARAGQFWVSCHLDQTRVQLVTRSGQVLVGEVTNRTVVTPFCIVLCASLEGYRRSVCQVVFCDAMQSEAFRELRVRLRFP